MINCEIAWFSVTPTIVVYTGGPSKDFSSGSVLFNNLLIVRLGRWKFNYNVCVGVTEFSFNTRPRMEGESIAWHGSGPGQVHCRTVAGRCWWFTAKGALNLNVIKFLIFLPELANLLLVGPNIWYGSEMENKFESWLVSVYSFTIYPLFPPPPNTRVQLNLSV